jgi:hypothetical protein
VKGGWREEIAILGRTDRNGFEASRARDAGCGPDRQARDLRADVLPVEEGLLGTGVRPGAGGDIVKSGVRELIRRRPGWVDSSV